MDIISLLEEAGDSRVLEFLEVFEVRTVNSFKDPNSSVFPRGMAELMPRGGIFARNLSRPSVSCPVGAAKFPRRP